MSWLKMLRPRHPAERRLPARQRHLTQRRPWFARHPIPDRSAHRPHLSRPSPASSSAPKRAVWATWPQRCTRLTRPIASATTCSTTSCPSTRTACAEEGVPLKTSARPGRRPLNLTMPLTPPSHWAHRRRTLKPGAGNRQGRSSLCRNRCWRFDAARAAHPSGWPSNPHVSTPAAHRPGQADHHYIPCQGSPQPRSPLPCVTSLYLTNLAVTPRSTC